MKQPPIKVSEPVPQAVQPATKPKAFNNEKRREPDRPLADHKQVQPPNMPKEPASPPPAVPPAKKEPSHAVAQQKSPETEKKPINPPAARADADKNPGSDQKGQATKKPGLRKDSDRSSTQARKNELAPGWVVVYPVDRQNEVPLLFPGNEEPDPIPEATMKMAGYPITATFSGQIVVKAVEAQLKSSDGSVLDIWLSSPEHPANPRFPLFYQRNTVCIMAKQPLRPDTTYTVEVKATLAKGRWARTWSFTTAKDAPVHPAQTTANAADVVRDTLNAYRKTAGLAPVTLGKALSRACHLHAVYLVKNADHPSTKGLGGHSEDPSLPGYTAEGEKAGKSSNIFFGQRSPAVAIDYFMSSFYHRIDLLDPDLRTIGFGCAEYPGGNTLTCVLDIRNGNSRRR